MSFRRLANAEPQIDRDKSFTFCDHNDTLVS